MTPENSSVVVTTPTDDDVETPLNVDAASITIGVSVVASELPVVVSVATTTLVTADPDIVATVPTPEAVCFVDVVVWGRQAETASEYLTKGSPAFIEGRLQFDQWENQEGEKRSKLRVRAERVQFLSSGASNGNNSSEFQADSGKVTPEDSSLDDDVPF